MNNFPLKENIPNTEESSMQFDLKVICGPACAPTLIQDIEDVISHDAQTDFRVTPWDNRRMRDGEFVPQILENIRGCDVYVVQPTNAPAENFEYMKLLLQAAAKASAFSVTAVFPYMGGLRQDRKDKPRVPITAKKHATEIEKAMAGAPRRHVMILHPHFSQIQGFFDEVPSDLLYPDMVFMPVIKRVLNGDFSRALPISPDAGGAKLTEIYMHRMGLDRFAIGHKVRDNNEKIKVVNIIGMVEGMIGTVHDDIVDTAGSLKALCQKALELGIVELYGFITHGVLPQGSDDCPGSIDCIRESGIKKLFITDSICHSEGYLPEDLIEVVRCGRLIGEAIYRNNTNGSISDIAGMFKP